VSLGGTALNPASPESHLSVKNFPQSPLPTLPHDSSYPEIPDN